MRTHAALWAFAFSIAVALGAAPVRADEPPPRVVVLLVVDQLPVRLWDRMLPVLPPGGLRRLSEGGASFIGRYAHANTSTAPGHALLATGADAGSSGIIGNNWWSRPTWKQFYCVEDPAYTVLGRPPREHDGTSPLTLRATGVADALRTSTLGRASILSLSWKDRGAILLGGFRPTAAVWFDAVMGGFTTSTYYARELP